MSSALHWFITIFAVANIIGCYVLIKWSSKPLPGESAQGEVTGHTWDEDLQELNNPMPRWWLWLFYITMVFALIYGAIYPTFGNFKGAAGWSQKQRYEQEISDADAKAEGVDERAIQEVSLRNQKRPGVIRAFHGLWDSINAKRGFGWDVNPWVWVVSYELMR